MALQIPSFPNPFDPAHPLANAYGWITSLTLSAAAGRGGVVLSINPNEGAFASTPVAQIAVSTGQLLVAADPAASPPVAEIRFPSLDELMADAEFAAAYALIGSRLYAALVAKHPALSGATQA